MPSEQLRIEVGGPDPEDLSELARLSLRVLQRQVYDLVSFPDGVQEELAALDLIEPRRFGDTTVWVLTNKGRGHPT